MNGHFIYNEIMNGQFTYNDSAKNGHFIYVDYILPLGPGTCLTCCHHWKPTVVTKPKSFLRTEISKYGVVMLIRPPVFTLNYSRVTVRQRRRRKRKQTATGLRPGSGSGPPTRTSDTPTL